MPLTDMIRSNDWRGPMKGELWLLIVQWHCSKPCRSRVNLCGVFFLWCLGIGLKEQSANIDQLLISQLQLPIFDTTEAQITTAPLETCKYISKLHWDYHINNGSIASSSLQGWKKKQNKMKPVPPCLFLLQEIVLVSIAHFCSCDKWVIRA